MRMPMIPVMMPPVRKLTNLGAALLKSYDGETTFVVLALSRLVRSLSALVSGRR
jgi:hypothetical protein